MTAFERLDTARAKLFQTVRRSINNAAFALTERSNLLELNADPLAADHLLLAEASVREVSVERLNAVAAMLEAADEGLRDVLAGANSRNERRAAIDRVDEACDGLSALLDEAEALAAGIPD